MEPWSLSTMNNISRYVYCVDIWHKRSPTTKCVDYNKLSSPNFYSEKAYVDHKEMLLASADCLIDFDTFEWEETFKIRRCK